MDVLYLDHHSTTPTDERVLEAMLPYFRNHFGNASSGTHQYGWLADEAVQLARQQAADLVNAHPSEIVFTSGATESNSLAILGVAEHYCSNRSGHFITQKTEHSAVLDTHKELERRGHRVTYLGVDRVGRINLDELKDAFTDDTVLVSIMHANNEIGTVQPIQSIGEICRDKRIMLHVDAAQTAGVISLDNKLLDASLISLSGHKMYGPKGVGALYVRRRGPRVQLKARAFGGGHENGRRSGTLNVPGIVGFGRAADFALKEYAQRYASMAILRERLENGLRKAGVSFEVNGCLADRLPHNSSLRFKGVVADDLMRDCRNLALSASAACASAEKLPSHVLMAIGLSETEADTTVRFGIGKDHTPADIDRAVEILSASISKLQAE